MKIKDLEKVFKLAKAHNADVCVELKILSREMHEFIIILNNNLDYKLNYYREKYDKNLIMNNFKDIQIVNAFHLVFMRQNT